MKQPGTFMLEDRPSATQKPSKEELKKEFLKSVISWDQFMHRLSTADKLSLRDSMEKSDYFEVGLQLNKLFDDYCDRLAEEVLA